MLTKIKDIGIVGTGTTPSMKNTGYYESNDVCFIKPGDIFDDKISYISDSNYYISNKAKEAARLFPKDTVLCVCIGSIGKIGITAKECSCNQQINYISNIINHDPLFVAYSLKSRVNELISIGEDSPIVPIVNKTRFENIQIPTFSKEKEKEIGIELHTLQRMINSSEKVLLEYDELIKSRFNELFGDPLLNEKRFPTEKLSSACPFNVYKGDVDTINGKVWLLNLDMIESNTGVILNKLYVDIAEVGNSVIKFDNDCVLYSKLRPYLNKVVVSYGSGYASSELVYMKTGKRIKKEFLANLLRTKSFVDYIDSKSGGAKMPRASMDFLRNFSLIIPPENLQEQFVAFVNQIDKSKFVVQQQIKDLKELLDKKMDEYFGGWEYEFWIFKWSNRF